ncbi:RNA polymerase subunit sigma [Clostridium gasigenes]|uniref:RNA polymerase subunit sigma n=1 Tax=Clostridium gasigenes TaxID=94869 RepID=UPI001C0BFF81|nr:RNA polymerase subunit sigma [Clostridium gasigenes]MBU3107158.1 RNA polymerase subunit sigma [Clostridium gasigenes]
MRNNKYIEALLYNYNRNKVDIKNMKLDLEVLENDYQGVGAIVYEERTQATNAFTSSVENEIIRRDEKIIKLRNDIRLKEIEVQKIDNIVESLSDKEQQFIRLKYFEKNTHNQISEKIDISFDYINEYRLKTLNKISRFILE